MQHSSSLVERWPQLSLAEQLGNAGSEYERAVSNKSKGQQDRFQNSSDRLLELLDLTLADPRWQNHRLKELSRLREQVCEELFNSQSFGPPGLQKYFYYFALEARIQKK